MHDLSAVEAFDAAQDVENKRQTRFQGKPWFYALWGCLRGREAHFQRFPRFSVLQQRLVLCELCENVVHAPPPHALQNQVELSLNEAMVEIIRDMGEPCHELNDTKFVLLLVVAGEDLEPHSHLRLCSQGDVEAARRHRLPQHRAEAVRLEPLDPLPGEVDPFQHMGVAFGVDEFHFLALDGLGHSEPDPTSRRRTRRAHRPCGSLAIRSRHPVLARRRQRACEPLAGARAGERERRNEHPADGEIGGNANLDERALAHGVGHGLCVGGPLRDRNAIRRQPRRRLIQPDAAHDPEDGHQSCPQAGRHRRKVGRLASKAFSTGRGLGLHDHTLGWGL
mmetsp:Transcript_124774/g.358346  ORF Transcript_124774/g.358346 Transcript_124774/m.358346 type:complete len:336 (-) Transcript_124774:1-1008(-)